MKQTGICLALASTLLLSVPQIAEALSGRRGTTINAVNASVFEVVACGSGRGADYWCGAADYARWALGVGWTQDIYIARGRGPSVTTGRKSAVQFTLDPTAAGITPASPSLSLNALKVGDSMSVQMANTYCSQPPVRP